MVSGAVTPVSTWAAIGVSMSFAGSVAGEAAATAAGCSACGGTGYRGRTGLFELLEVNDAIREGIMAGRPSGELERAAGPRTSLRADAVAKARAGLISLDEVVRVLGQG